MAWMGGYDGTVFDRESCARYIDAIPADKLRWIKFLTLHNSGLPNMVMARKTSEGQRMKNAAVGYKQRGWPGGPQFWVFESGKIAQGTPLEAGPGAIHSPSWNKTSVGVEMVADFDGTDDPNVGGGAVIFDTTAWLFAHLLGKLGLPANEVTVRLHKQDPRTTHDCPGKLVKKDAFLEKVRRYMKPPAALAPKPAELAKAPIYVWTNTPRDTLNFRTTPGGTLKGAVPHGTKLEVLQTNDTWAEVKTPAGFVGWVFAKFLEDDGPTSSLPPTAPPPASQPVPPADGLMAPGGFKMSEFGVSWCRRFEGLMLTAYWDKNDYAIGFGHNNGSGVPPAVKKGDTITAEQAHEILARDVKLQEHYLNAYVSAPLTQGQVDALCLNIFQQGPGNFREGRVRPFVNAGQHEEAAKVLENWPTSNAGLKRRRKVEAEIYRGGKPTKW